MPAENGLPQYVSKNARSGFYQYYRRPPTGVAGSAFVRSFGSKDRKAVREKYAAIHAEAEVYFARLISGRAIPDFDLKVAAMALSLSEIVKDGRPLDGSLLSPGDFLRRLREIEPHSAARLSEADAKALLKFTMQGYLSTEGDRVAEAEQGIAAHRHALRAASTPAPTPKDALTLRMAFDQAWMPAKSRSSNSVTEVGRYVDEFEALNGVRDLGEYDRSHWAAWRKYCLGRHGPGATAFKRFSMMKTVCNEAIRAGLFERKNFHGQDVSMAKIKGKKLRNEGWLPDELKNWFGQPVFKGDKSGPHADADYWASVIIAYTGAAIIEVSHMDTAEIVQRHGFWTMRLWRDKSHNSDRIIPIPKQVLDLGFLDYVRSRPKNAPLPSSPSRRKRSGRICFGEHWERSSL